MGGGLEEAYGRARRLLEAALRLRLVTHLDLDGVGAAAILLRWARGRGVEARHRVTGVRGVYRVLQGELRASLGDGSLVVAADVAPRGRGDAAALSSILRRGARLVWLDHHVWSPDVAGELEAAGGVIVVDRSRVTAEIACRLVDCWGDQVSRAIVEAARADDSCSEDPLGLAPRWRLVLRALGPRETARAAEALAAGDLWPRWAEEVYERVAPGYYEEIRRSTRLQVYEFEGVRVAVVTPPPRASACDVERVLGTPAGVDLVVLLYPRGLSIRSLDPRRIPADCVASRLGGGGHPGAAGAPRPSTTMGAAQVARMVARAARACMGERGGG